MIKRILSDLIKDFPNSEAFSYKQKRMFVGLFPEVADTFTHDIMVAVKDRMWKYMNHVIIQKITCSTCENLVYEKTNHWVKVMHYV